LGKNRLRSLGEHEPAESSLDKKKGEGRGKKKKKERDAACPVRKKMRK